MNTWSPMNKALYLNILKVLPIMLCLACSDTSTPVDANAAQLDSQPRLACLTVPLPRQESRTRQGLTRLYRTARRSLTRPRQIAPRLPTRHPL